MGDLIEELWYFPSDVTEEEIRNAYKDYQYSEYDSFEDYINEFNPKLEEERVFVNEIYID